VLKETIPGLNQTLGEALLATHHCYYQELKPLLPWIKGMAHITGGGLPDNTPRILPKGVAARFEVTWNIPPLFSLIQRRGNIDDREMYRTFNMGIGMVVVVSPADKERIQAALPQAKIIGRIVKQEGKERAYIISGGN